MGARQFRVQLLQRFAERPIKRVANDGGLPGQRRLRSPGRFTKSIAAGERLHEKRDVRRVAEVRFVHAAHGAGRAFGHSGPHQFSVVLRRVFAL